jgi:hypothetical protein
LRQSGYARIQNKKGSQSCLDTVTNPGSAPTAQQTRAQLEQISGIKLAVAILIEQAAEDASCRTALRLDLAALLIQGIAQVAGPMPCDWTRLARKDITSGASRASN